MPKERLFFTGSTNIIGDPRPSGLDLRVYACVSLHDGMSLMPGRSGRGCYATFATMTARLGCDQANLSRSLKRLVEWGYLTEERQNDDRRRKTYRVVFDDAESWQSRQPSVDTGKLADSPSNGATILSQSPSNSAELVGNGELLSNGKQVEIVEHYSSLKGLNPLKEKLYSSEEARFAARSSQERVKFCENVGAQLAVLERLLKSREPIDDLIKWYEYVASAWGFEEHRHRADRLADDLLGRMTPEQREQCVTL